MVNDLDEVVLLARGRDKPRPLVPRQEDGDALDLCSPVARPRNVLRISNGFHTLANQVVVGLLHQRAASFERDRLISVRRDTPDQIAHNLLLPYPAQV